MADSGTRRLPPMWFGFHSGNLIEWYASPAYAAFIVYFASVFFPSGIQTPRRRADLTTGVRVHGGAITATATGRQRDRFGEVELAAES